MMETDELNFDIVKFVKDNPDDFLLVAKITSVLIRYGNNVSLRTLSKEVGIQFMTLKRRIIKIASKMSVDTHCDTLLIQNDICKSVSYAIYRYTFDTLGDTLKRKEPKENISFVVDNKLSPTQEYNNIINSHTNSHARDEVVEFNSSLVASVDRNKESYTQYETYLLWISDECPDLLKIMKLPREDNYMKMLGYFGFDIIKETIRDMNNNFDYLVKKKYKEIGQTSFNWAKRSHPFGKPMVAKNPNDVNEVKFCNWVNKYYPALNTLPVPFGYEDYCYLIGIFDKNEVTMAISYFSGTGFKNVGNLKDAIEYMLYRRQNEKK